MQVLPPCRTGGPSRLFIMRPVATTLLMVAILLAGIIGYRFAGLRPAGGRLPDHSGSHLYPGASPDVVTSAITAPLERQFGQMSGLKQMSSQSSGGASVVTLQFQLTRRWTSPSRKCRRPLTPPPICCRAICRIRRSTAR